MTDSYYTQLTQQWRQLGLVCSSVRMVPPHVAVYPLSAHSWYLRLGTTTRHVIVRYSKRSLTVVDALPPGSHTVIHVATPKFNKVMERCLLVPHMLSYSDRPADVVTWIVSGQLCNVDLPTHPTIVRRQAYTKRIHAFMHS